MSYNQFVYDIPAGIGEPPELPANCVVHFRPLKKWKGEFGFDWLRIDDTGMFGDTHYAKIMGRYETSKGTVCDDPNGWTKMTHGHATEKDSPCSFVINHESYKDLLHYYYPIAYTIPWKMPDPRKTPKRGWKGEMEKTKYTYYVPVMTLINGNKADLNLHVEVEPKKAPPKRIDVKQRQSDGAYLTISGTASPKNGKYPITVNCVGEFSEFQVIDAWAIYDDPASGTEIEKLCGQLRVVPNDQQAEAKIVFIKVTMDIGNCKKTGAPTSEADDELDKILLQSYTQRTVEKKEELFININQSVYYSDTEEYPVSALVKRKDGEYFFKSANGLPRLLISHLKNSLKKRNLEEDRYDNYIKIFFINEMCMNEKTNSDDAKKTNGSTSYEDKTIVMFNNQENTKETLAHEVFHTLSLHHPFVSKDGCPEAPRALYTYKAQQTENILDYSHQKGKTRYSTWYWQWRVIWEELGIDIPWETSNIFYPYDIIQNDNKYEYLA